MKGSSSMVPRCLTGGVLLAAVIAALAFQGWALWALIVLMSTAALWEFYALFKDMDGRIVLRVSGLAVGILMLLAARFAQPSAAGVFCGVVPLLLTASLFAWARGRGTAFSDTAFVMAGLCYVPLMLMPVPAMSLHEQLFLIGTTTLTDTAAYFVGSAWGRHRIWPVVSPGKSVEGCLAGLAASMGWAVAMGWGWGTLHPAWYLGIGAAFGIVSMLGDFFESALKRSAGVKDSGRLLPGHGGVLDRIDSLLFVVPVYACVSLFVTLFK